FTSTLLPLTLPRREGHSPTHDRMAHIQWHGCQRGQGTRLASLYPPELVSRFAPVACAPSRRYVERLWRAPRNGSSQHSSLRISDRSIQKSPLPPLGYVERHERLPTMCEPPSPVRIALRRPPRGGGRQRRRAAWQRGRCAPAQSPRSP